MTPFQNVPVVRVMAWGQTVGALAFDPRDGAHVFEYDDAWIARGVELSPFITPITQKRSRYYKAGFNDPFQGVPPFIADSLPDTFGDKVMDEFLHHHGLTRQDLTVLDRLAYTGQRGMGALVFEPAVRLSPEQTHALTMRELVQIARAVELGQPAGDVAQLVSILVRVGGTAGGAHPKALVGFRVADERLAIYEEPYEPGFVPHVLKLHTATGTHFTSPARIEHAYAIMAAEAGLTLPPTRIIEADGVSHFLIKRFDRHRNQHIHIQTLAALRGLNFQRPSEYSELMIAVNLLGLDREQRNEAFRRVAFNVLGSVTDDHAKNLAFQCIPNGTWTLAPAYDLTFSAPTEIPRDRLPPGHTSAVFGKRTGVTVDDLKEFGADFDVTDADPLIDRICHSIDRWRSHAERAECSTEDTDLVAAELTSKTGRWIRAQV